MPVGPSARAGSSAPVAYAELHCLSNFSFLRGASHPEELVEQAAALGYAGLAITDRNSLAGVVRAHVAAKDAGLHLIIGAEITPADAPPVVLLAPHREAYARLARLITRGRRRAPKGDCRLVFADIAELAAGAGWIAIVLPDIEAPGERTTGGDTIGTGVFTDKADIGADVTASCADTGDFGANKTRFCREPAGSPKDMLRFGPERLRFCPDRAATACDGHDNRARAVAAGFSRPFAFSHAGVRGFGRYRDVFGDDAHLAAALRYDVPDAARLAGLEVLSRASGLPLVACNDVHYHVPQRRYLQDVLTCIREKCTVHEAGSRLFANAERHLRPLDEIARRYAARLALLERSAAIAARCTFSLDELRYEYPHELCPPDVLPMEYLRRLVWLGAAERYGRSHGGSGRPPWRPSCAHNSHGKEDPPVVPPTRGDGVRRKAAEFVPARVLALLDRELALIQELQYEHYFLTVWDLVRFARECGILCQGRGSAANSAVCYCLGVTAVDPDRHDLLFERFVSKERNEPPDIDIDFEHERREEVFQYIYEKYGRERAAITAEVITYRPRSAVRDVGKALGLPLDRVDALAKALDWWSREAVPEDALRSAGLDPADRTVRMVVRLVRQLLGFPRHLSQHVGGFVITESPLCEIVPLENGAMPGRTFIEWDKDDIDALGILKVDCLALGMLTALSRAFEMLGGHHAGGGEGLRDLGIEGLRDLGIEGFRDLGIEGLRKERRGGNKDLSGFDRVAESRGAGTRHILTDQSASAIRTVRIDSPDAPRSRIGRQQHRRGKCTPNPQGLHTLSRSRPGFPGRAGNPGPDRIRTEAPSQSGTVSQSDSRGFGDAPGTDQPTSSTARLTNPQSLNPSVPQSLPHSIPKSLSPPIPQSLLDIPSDDPAVYDMICDADTVGVFQIESRAQMSMLPRLKPRCFYDLVIEVAIVRPGPIQGGMVHPYLRRRDGREPVAYPSDAVRVVLEKTLGVPLFQEQVMRLAVVAAGFTPGQADQLRRSMAAWRRSGQLEKFQVQLVQGMLRNGYPRAFAERIFKQIRGFGEYGFPESHAASFAHLVYASAWMKRYHPAAFCGAILNSQPMGFYAPAQLVRDALRHGVTVRPVDVNASAWDCTLEKATEPGERRRPAGWEQSHDGENPPVVPPRRGDNEMEIVLTRGNGVIGRATEPRRPGSVGVPPAVWGEAWGHTKPYPLPKREGGSSSGRPPWRPDGGRDARPTPHCPQHPVTAACRERSRSTPALRLGFRLVRGLSEAKVAGIVAAQREGPIRSLRQLARRPDVSRETLLRLAAADAFRSLGLSRRKALWQILAHDDVDLPLFAALEADEPAPPLPPMPLDEVVVHDYDALGLSLNAHPISLVRNELTRLRVSPNETLGTARHGRRISVCGLVTHRQRPSTAKGIVFITLEDESGTANLIVRPGVWERYRSVGRGKIALIAYGTVERQGKVVHVQVSRLRDLSAAIGPLRSRSRDFH